MTGGRFVATQKKSDLASSGFANGRLYNSARPNYPTPAIDFFVSTLGLNHGSHVLDLGAGTGIFSRQILAHVGRLTAVDPSASMRESFRAATPGVVILDGSDVSIPLEDASVDAVFVAQAFHWFDAPKALLEIRRVLRSDGGLGLVWNERDESVRWVRELSRAMRWDVEQPYRVGADFSSVLIAGPFVDVRRVQFRHAQSLSRDDLYRRVLTTSYVAVMADAQRDELMSDVAAIVERQPEIVVLPYVTDVYSALAAPRADRVG